jgi:hypothetical protein
MKHSDSFLKGMMEVRRLGYLSITWQHLLFDIAIHQHYNLMMASIYLSIYLSLGLVVCVCLTDHVSEDLQMTAILCQNGRRNLRHAAEELTRQPLDIVANSQRINRYKALVSMIEILKRIKQREALLYQALDDGDFPQAISLCLEVR